MEWMFVEAPEFTRRIVKLRLDDELPALQAELLANPRAGAVERGTCGLRKIRMRDPGREQGKRFGARVHYVFVPRDEAIYLMSVYPKNEQSLLTPAQKKMICRKLASWGAE
jgi:hypothetical protein